MWKCRSIYTLNSHFCVKILRYFHYVPNIVLDAITYCYLSYEETGLSLALSETLKTARFCHSEAHIIPRLHPVIKYNVHVITWICPFYNYSEETHKVIDGSTLYSEIVKRKLHDRMDHLQCRSKRQDFVGKIGVLYGDLKCNITQAWNTCIYSYYCWMN